MQEVISGLMFSPVYGFTYFWIAALSAPLGTKMQVTAVARSESVDDGLAGLAARMDQRGARPRWRWLRENYRNLPPKFRIWAVMIVWIRYSAVAVVALLLLQIFAPSFL